MQRKYESMVITATLCAGRDDQRDRFRQLCERHKRKPSEMLRWLIEQQHKRDFAKEV